MQKKSDSHWWKGLQVSTLVSPREKMGERNQSYQNKSRLEMTWEQESIQQQQIDLGCWCLNDSSSPSRNL